MPVGVTSDAGTKARPSPARQERPVTSLRLLIAARSHWFAVLMACTLAARLLVPVGFMPVTDHGRVTLQICPGTMPTVAAHAMAGMHHDQPAGGEHGKAEMPCAYSGLGLTALGSVAPVLLAAAVLFAFLLAARAVALVLPAPPGRLRPPLRAPPLTA
ncbi:hypothetical protein [Sphingomonas sp.]|uniref:hypothetical protein n=1 Tax=Sphingomonas sp. TaxID=28214 RepID=UPI003B008C61